MLQSMTGHPVVDAIGKINFEGHQVPHTWYEHLTYTNKRGTYCHHLAILLLADILYWHRPTLVKDEATGEILGWRKKFKSDKLQRSYKALATQLGATDRQVREAAHFLQNLGLIDLEFRTFETPEGLTLVNVMYISCNPEAISHITFSRKKGGGVTEMGDTSPRNRDSTHRNGGEVTPNSVTGQTEFGKDTEITTKISTETKNKRNPPIGPPRGSASEPPPQVVTVEVMEPEPTRQTSNEGMTDNQTTNPTEAVKTKDSGLDQPSAVPPPRSTKKYDTTNQRRIDGSDILPWDTPRRGEFDVGFEQHMARSLMGYPAYRDLMAGELQTKVRKHISAGRHDFKRRDELLIEWQAYQAGISPGAGGGMTAKAASTRAHIAKALGLTL